MGKTLNIDWDQIEDLGKMTDDILAEKLGCHKSSVQLARTTRNIPPAGRLIAITPDLLPIIEDELRTTWAHAVAIKYNVPRGSVMLIRQRLGINAYSEQRTCFCGNTFKAIRSNHIACSRSCRVKIASMERSLKVTTGTELSPELIRMYVQTTVLHKKLDAEPKGIDWDSVSDLGYNTDTTIAKRLGCARESVRWARQVRNIPSCPRKTFDWYSIKDFGKVLDSIIAERIGMHVGTVYKARRMRGIQSYQYEQRKKIIWKRR